MKYEFDYEVYSSHTELAIADQELVEKSFAATQTAYSPYSNFRVGTAAITNNGHFITGGNQENSSYSVTICGERVLLSALSSQYPGEYITTIAISYIDTDGKSNTPITPCGVCRQALFEHETFYKHNIRIILSSQTGQVYIISKAKDLLPLPFSLDN